MLTALDFFESGPCNERPEYIQDILGLRIERQRR